MRRATVFLLIVFILGFIGNAYAFELTRIQIRTVLPKEINTVGEAAQYYADVIGYRLVTRFPAPEESGRIAAEPISPLYFTNNVLAVEDAILAILREPYALVIDHDHKLLSFAKGAAK